MPNAPGQSGRFQRPAEPYTPPASPATAYGPAYGGQWTSARTPAVEDSRHHLRFAIFHDGNPGHLWRGELGSLLGDAVLSVGVIMWLAMLTYSPRAVGLGLIALGLPALLAGPVGVTLTRVEEPARLFKLLGWLRILFAAALITMHYLTIFPVLYLLLFGVSLLGRLRTSLRIAAMRACLAPGEPEHVAASSHLAAVGVAVAGPLLATLLFILDGERILLVAIGAAVFFLLGVSADALVDALPASQRAFLLAVPSDLDEDVYAPAVEEPDAADDDPEALMERTELALPEWEQWGPGNVREAVEDVANGMRLIGSRAVSLSAMRALSVLALIGGGITLFEVFYVTDHLNLPTFYLGALVAAEGAGVALGATLWRDLGRAGSGRVSWLVGMLGVSLALGALVLVGTIQPALLIAVALGAANGLAVEGARQSLRAGFDGVERRAITAGESFITALCAMAGVAIFALLHRGYAVTRHGKVVVTLLQSFPVTLLFLGAGVGLAIAALLFAFWGRILAFFERQRDRRLERAEQRRAARGEEYDDEDDGYYPDAGGEWDDAGYDDGYADDGRGGYDDSRYMTGYQTGYQPEYQESRAYPQARPPARRGGAREWDDGDEEDEGNWSRTGRAPRPGPRTPPGRGRRR
jgi:hypothetical protein